MAEIQSDILSGSTAYILAYVSALIAAFKFFLGRIKNTHDRSKYLGRLVNPKLSKLYRYFLGLLLELAKKCYGPKYPFLKAFGFSSGFSLVYSLAFFFIGWLSGGTGEVGKLQFLPDNIEKEYKLLFCAFTFFIGGLNFYFSGKWIEAIRNDALLKGTYKICFLSSLATAFCTMSACLSISIAIMDSLFLGFIAAFLVHIIGIGSWYASKLTKVFLKFNNFLGESISVVSAGLVSVLSVAPILFLVANVSKDQNVNASILCMISAACGVVFSIWNIALVGATASLAVLFGGVLSAFYFLINFDDINVGLMITIALFFSFLPALNAIWDTVSVIISRILGEHIYNKKNIHIGTFLFHLFLDFLAAAFLLSCLAYTLKHGIGYFNVFLIDIGYKPYILDLSPLIHDAVDDPWGKGLWITMMLVTTVFPTAIHLIFALGGPLAFFLSRRFKIRLMKLIGKNDNDWEEEVAAFIFSFSFVNSGLFIVVFVGFLLDNLPFYWKPFSYYLLKIIG